MTVNPGIQEEVLNATIIDRQDLTETLCIVRIRPDSGVVPDFQPGQFMKLGLPRVEAAVPVAAGTGRPRSGPRLIRRAYSIASSPRQRDYIEFLMVRVDLGKLTPRLWELEQGGRVWMEDSAGGQFTLEAIPPNKDVVMVATGTGVAPFISMVRTFADPPRWRRAVLINGVRYAADLAYRQELEALSRSHPWFTYIPIVSREPEAIAAPPMTAYDSARPWSGLRGHVQHVLDPAIYESLVGKPLVPSKCHVMLCGNPEMIVSVQRLLEDRGFHTHSTAQPGNIHFERYW